MKSKQIIEGSINNLLNKQEKLYLERIIICKKCKLYIVKPFVGAICNNKLFYNIELDKISKYIKPGYKKGCGCILNSKCRVNEAKCPLGKW